MKKLYSLLFLSIPFAAAAQPSFTSSMNPTLSSTYTTVNNDTTGVTPGASGANVTWNFTLTPISGTSSTMGYTAPSATPYASSFPSANLAYASGGTYVYYTTGSTSSELIGMANPNFTMVYTNTQKLFAYPTAYSGNFTDNLSSSYTISGFPATRTGTVTFTYDAYGTLNLNGTNYPNVMRMKYTQDITDDIGSGLSVNNLVSTTYAWYQGTTSAPLLSIIYQTITSGGNPSSSKFVQTLDPSTGIDRNEFAAEMNVYPNPSAGSDVTVFYKADKVEALTLEVINALGQKVEIQSVNPSAPGFNNLQLNVSSLEKGIYYLRFVNEAGQASDTKSLMVN